VIECRRPEDHRRADQVDTTDPGVSVGAEVVRDDVPAVRPGNEDGPLEPCLVDNRSHVIGPQLPIGIVFRPGGLFRQAVPAKVERDDAERTGQIAAHLV